MSLYDKLMAVDDNVIHEKRSKEVHSARLSALFGTETSVKVEALPYRQVCKYMEMATKSNGMIDMSKAVDSRCHLIRLAVKEIPWGDKELQDKFGASDPKDLVEKLFDYDIGIIGDAVLEVSGYTDTEEEEQELEEEVKN